MSMYIGEALDGDGNEVAHIDLLIGDKAGPVGSAFANALANQSQGHSNLLAVLAPNLLAKPATVLITKVTIKGAKQAVQMFGPAQYAVAKAVADSVEAGVIPKDQCDNLVIICGVFIHWEASDDKKIVPIQLQRDQARHRPRHEERTERQRNAFKEGDRQASVRQCVEAVSTPAAWHPETNGRSCSVDITNSSAGAMATASRPPVADAKPFGCQAMPTQSRGPGTRARFVFPEPWILALTPGHSPPPIYASHPDSL